MNHTNMEQIPDEVLQARAEYFRLRGHRAGETYTNLASTTGLDAEDLRHSIKPAGTKILFMDAWSRRASRRVEWEQRVDVPAFPDLYRYIASGDLDEDLIDQRELWCAGIELGRPVARHLVTYARRELQYALELRLVNVWEKCGCYGYRCTPCAMHSVSECVNQFRQRMEELREAWSVKIREAHLGFEFA